jgi:HEAT repeat protein
MTAAMKSEQLLDSIFRAERDLRHAEGRLLDTRDKNALANLLARATQEALDLRDEDEAALRLGRLADLCAQVPGPQMVDTLIAILDSDDESVRVQAGEALLDVGYDRYAEVARGIERALDRKHTGIAMTELPWILAEIGEPSALGLIRRFLASDDGEICASALEALVSLGDPSGADALDALVDDPREVTVDGDDDEGKGLRTTIRQLAREAIAELRGGDGDEG